LMRWTPKRKAAIVTAVQHGEITGDDVAREHGISAEELASWIRDHDAHGRAGMRVTRLQMYGQRRPPVKAPEE
jgi:transposase-like protein